MIGAQLYKNGLASVARAHPKVRCGCIWHQNGLASVARAPPKVRCENYVPRLFAIRPALYFWEVQLELLNVIGPCQKLD